MKKRAILIMTYGSPNDYSFEGIADFFTNIRRGKRPKEEEIKKLYENYKKINSSPLQKISKKTVELLKERIDIPIYFANKFSYPFIFNKIEEMEKDKIEECLCLILEPHYSIYSSMGYERFIKSEKIKFNIIKEWYKNPHLISYWANAIHNIIKNLNPSEYRVIFSAHSVPIMATTFGDPYINQIIDNVTILKEKLKLKDENFARVWQSESDIGMEWVKPDVIEYIKSEKNIKKNYIFVPISFISDHIETLFDNDIRCYEECKKLNINYFRPPSPNYNKKLIDALEEEIRKNINNNYTFKNDEKFTNEMEIKKGEMPDFIKKILQKNKI